VAPEGYTIATDTTFSIDETGKVTTTGTVTEDGVILIEDAKTRVKVSKVDMGTGEELEGATIQIIDKDGNVVDAWISGKEVHTIEGLKTGEEYILRETVAPEGYTIATDTTFSIDETGKVTTTASVTEDGIILIEDAKTRVKVSKVDSQSGEKLAGIVMQILDSEGNVAEEWTTTSEGVHTVEGLKTGVTYTLHESEAPEGYILAEDKTFTIDETGAVTGTVTLDTDDTGDTLIIFENTAITYTSLTVTKKWNGKDKGAVDLYIYCGLRSEVIREDGTLNLGAMHRMDPQPTIARKGNTYTVTDLPAVDGGGNALVYAAQEYNIPEYYAASYSNVDEFSRAYTYAFDRGVITNTFDGPVVEYTSITIHKVWTGIGGHTVLPDITLKVYRENGTLVKTVTRSAAEIAKKGGSISIGGLVKGSTYYVVEDAIKGYSIKYTNVGTAAETTDRVYDGGTITNHRIPKTGDSRPVAMWMVLALVSAMGIGAVVITERKKRRTN
ncbi:MAG: Cna B-type domain-containing protein, partial [Clostridia bacterium]|nr:Cna B-type domain-containing protein [Clostridia bacterium]